MCPVTGYTYFNIYEILEKIKEYYEMKEINMIVYPLIKSAHFII